MQREIKFRGKRLDNDPQTGPSDGWVHGFYEQDWYIGKMRHFIKSCPCVWEIDPNTVGQYTGLKDKNGREIYEGDIISARGIILTVKYIGGVFFACNVDSNIDKYPLYILCEWENESGCEIIGNIHNNPELLKTK